MTSLKPHYSRRFLLGAALLAATSCAEPTPQDEAACEQWVEWREAPSSLSDLVALSEGLLIGSVLGISTDRTVEGEAFLITLAVEELKGHVATEDGESAIYFPHLGSDRCDNAAFGGLPFALGKRYAVFVETSYAYSNAQTVAFGPTGVLEVDESSIRGADASKLEGAMPESIDELLSSARY